MGEREELVLLVTLYIYSRLGAMSARLSLFALVTVGVARTVLSSCAFLLVYELVV
jgi:hypothetical protein